MMKAIFINHNNLYYQLFSYHTCRQDYSFLISLNRLIQNQSIIKTNLLYTRATKKQILFTQYLLIVGAGGGT